MKNEEEQVENQGIQDSEAGSESKASAIGLVDNCWKPEPDQQTT